MSNKIYIGNLPASATKEDLIKLFSPHGQIISAQVVLGMDRKKNAGYGYVSMSNDREVNNAILKINRTVLKGNTIRVIEAHPIDQDRNYLSKRNRFNRFNRFRRR